MKYFSMFSGIGGFDFALNERGHECVGYSEIDGYAIETYIKNFGDEVKNYGDAKKIESNELPDFDMLCGGFPCQAFSIAGKRRGFEDTRGTLFFEVARIVKDKKPKIVFLENVKGLLNHKKGETFRTILQTLSELGYYVQWMVLNSKFLGVPQNRERVFIIGHLGEGSPNLLLPLQRETEGNIKYAHFDRCQSYRVLKTEGISSCLSTCATGGRHVPKILTEKGVRQLTPTEFERLQSFPDTWTEGCSDTQRFKQLGNAVTVNVVRALIPQLENLNDLQVSKQ